MALVEGSSLLVPPEIIAPERSHLGHNQQSQHRKLRDMTVRKVQALVTLHPVSEYHSTNSALAAINSELIAMLRPSYIKKCIYKHINIIFNYPTVL